ncbi:MAG: hypothetical protein RIF33_19780 [Cyclobacteriaceae bacterium]
MDFEEYLNQKKIDGRAFSKADPNRFGEFKFLFDQMHPNSFTAQKLFLINEIRRKFPVGKETIEDAAPAKKARPRPKMALPKKE